MVTSLADTNGAYHYLQYSKKSLPQGLLFSNGLVSVGTVESVVYTLLKVSCYSSITMCQYWDNWLIY